MISTTLYQYYHYQYYHYQYYNTLTLLTNTSITINTITINTTTTQIIEFLASTVFTNYRTYASYCSTDSSII